jgi:hypothetical protein
VTESADGLLELLASHRAVMPSETVHVVFVYEEGGTPVYRPTDVRLRGFSSRERDAFEADSLQRSNAKNANGGKRAGAAAPMQADLTNFRARLVARHIVNSAGNRIFANKQGEETLGDQPASVLDPLFAASQRLSGFTAEDVEKLAGNSDATDADSSSSSSPELSAEPSLN